MESLTESINLECSGCQRSIKLKSKFNYWLEQPTWGLSQTRTIIKTRAIFKLTAALSLMRQSTHFEKSWSKIVKISQK